MLDAVTAVSGSGPAYVFFFIEALQAAGLAMGMTAEQARQLSLATFLGASKLAAQSGEPIATLREQVTSKGGTTAAALDRMRALDLQQHIISAAYAALERSRELARTYGDTV
jgi:pyrroline-5-carboxylate reductase